MAFAALQADCKNMIAQIRYLTNEELDAILNEDEKTNALMNSLDQNYLKDIAMEKESLLEKNKEIAEGNLAREPQLVEGRETIENLSREGEELSNCVKAKYDQIRREGGDMSPETALALLQTAASEIEEESEKTAQNFLGGDIELDQFLDQFLTKRKLLHLRQLKAEKLMKIVSRDPLMNSNYMNTPPLSINANYFPGVPQNPMPTMVPYPTGPFNMPMPQGNFYPNNF